MFIGHTVSKLDKVDSTNRYLRDLIAADKASEGFVVWGLEQYAGRGQRGNAWYSEPGANLTLSIALRPTFLNVSKQFWLTKAIALGVAEFVSNSLGTSFAGNGTESVAVRIKWANDIFVNDRKIAGILIENVLENATIKYSIAGIGVNINQINFDPLLPNPTSLKLLAGKDFDLSISLDELCISIERYYLLLRNSDFSRIDDLYHKLLYRKDVWSNFVFKGKPFRGMVKKVGAQGHLLLNTHDFKELQNPEGFFEITDIKQLQFL